jgi:hypothetical protein
MNTENIQVCEDCGGTLAYGQGVCLDCEKVLCAECLNIDPRCLWCMTAHDHEVSRNGLTVGED